MLALTTKTESKLQAAEMKLLRLIKGVTRRDRRRNTAIRNYFNMVPLIEDIERGRLRWYGHVMRMEGEKKQRKYLEWSHDEKQPVGHPRRRWKEGVDKALQSGRNQKV